MEIESLMKLFNINNLRDISSSNANHIKALQMQQPNSITQQVELTYLNQRSKFLPFRQKTQFKQSEPSPGPYSREIASLHQSDSSY